MSVSVSVSVSLSLSPSLSLSLYIYMHLSLSLSLSIYIYIYASLSLSLSLSPPLPSFPLTFLASDGIVCGPLGHVQVRDTPRQWWKMLHGRYDSDRGPLLAHLIGRRIYTLVVIATIPSGTVVTMVLHAAQALS